MSDYENTDAEMVEEEYSEEEGQEEQGQEQEISLEDYNKLQNELEQLRKYQKKANEEAKNYRLKAKAYEDAGYSPEELKEIKEKEEKRKMRELESKQDFNKLKETLQSQFQTKEQEYQSKIDQLQSSMEKTLIQRDVTSAIAKHEGIETLLRPHIESNVKLMENDDGTLIPRVVDTDGSPKFNTKGEYMSVEDYVASLREHDDFGVAFRGRGQSGSGTKAAPTEGRKAIPKKARAEMNDNERRDFVQKYGWDAYHELPVS